LPSANGNVCADLTDDTDDDRAAGWLSYDSTLEDVSPLWDELDERMTEFCHPFGQ
jgi:hypothetical protein